MKKLILTFVLLISFQALADGDGAKTLLNFRDWKAEKIQSIQAKITTLKFQVEAAKKPENKAKSSILIAFYERSLNQEKWNLEVATDLNITDYLVLYVVRYPSQEKFKGAAALLTPAEVAQLMEAYSITVGALNGPSSTVGNSSTSLLGRSRTAGRQ